MDNNTEPFAQLERAVTDLRVSIEKRFDAVDQRFDAVDHRLDSVEQELELIRQEIRQGDADTRSQLSVLIESVRDDVRIVAEGHVALERRVTALEHRSP